MRNGSVVKGWDAVRVPPHVEMAAFDSLPRRLRDAVNDAPFNFASAWIAQQYREGRSEQSLLDGFAAAQRKMLNATRT